MNCDNIKMMISDYLDTELPKGEEGFLFTHLATCSDCREDFKQQQLIQHEVKVNQKEVSEKFEERVVDSIELRKKSFRFFSIGKISKEFITGIKVATVSALAVCVIIISLIVNQNKINVPGKIKINSEVLNVDDQVELIFGNKLDQQLDEIESQLRQIKNY